MTQKLTTEVLAQIKADIAARKAMPEFGESIEGNIKRLHVIGATRDHFSTEAVEMLVNALDALLANREAQPVALVDRRSAARGSICWQGGGKDLPHGTELFTAPPAPAVPEEISVSLETIANGYQLSIPQAEAYRFGWNECRAAMLNHVGDANEKAQPVSQGYKLNSPETPDGCQWTFDEHDSKWDSGCGEAWMFCDGSPTENGVKFCQSCGKPVLLAAAPEGGNG
ncbi:hypothetical protein JEM67_16180 [Serratia sp. PAMC26656]|uniref:hypothetical protein n=1 Tax=Serratia sp. PAMC26656 TaxID=2775909 RepID=UPI0018F388E8|nr:hypothetical protein [Serratia sp. PAMC26656]MBJ7889407.1 hypothetical protein [Serratia sp. PAMC26656]